MVMSVKGAPTAACLPYNCDLPKHWESLYSIQAGRISFESEMAYLSNERIVEPKQEIDPIFPDHSKYIPKATRRNSKLKATLSM